MASVAEAVPSSGKQQAQTEEDDLILAIVEAVAAARDADPMTLDPSLIEQIDLDALTALYRSSQDSDASLTVEFTVDGCTVTVCGDGEVTTS